LRNDCGGGPEVCLDGGVQPERDRLCRTWLDGYRNQRLGRGDGFCRRRLDGFCYDRLGRRWLDGLQCQKLDRRWFDSFCCHGFDCCDGLFHQGLCRGDGLCRRRLDGFCYDGLGGLPCQGLEDLQCQGLGRRWFDSFCYHGFDCCEPLFHQGLCRGDGHFRRRLDGFGYDGLGRQGLDGLQ
jgi:hypothetical protein